MPGERRSGVGLVLVWVSKDVKLYPHPRLCNAVVRYYCFGSRVAQEGKLCPVLKLYKLQRDMHNLGRVEP